MIDKSVKEVSIPTLGDLENISSTFMAEDNLIICDNSLEGEVIRNELSSINSCRDDFDLEIEVKERGNNCITLVKSPAGFYLVTSNQNRDMVLISQDCSQKHGNFDCSFKITPVPKGKISRVTLKEGATILALTHDEVKGCENFPRTRGHRTVLGKITRPYYNIKPLEAPFDRTAFITQCYNGPYSHQNLYALDFSSRDEEEILNTKPGVVVLSMKGSDVYCRSSKDSFGDMYWKIMKNNEQVSTRMESCPSCVYYTFPTVCKSSLSANRVMLWHPDNTYSWYSHLHQDNDLVKVGDVIESGQPIGKSGWSGWLSGTHLHLEVLEMQMTNASYNFNTVPTYFRTSSGNQYPCRIGTTIRPAIE